MTESDVSRRSFVKGAAAGSIALAAASATSAGLVGLTTADAAPAKNKVAILGGGIAGLTAAHELVERGFDVTIYERRAWGGKARSIETPIPPTGGRKPLPGEHGFRFFPGFYQAIPDTMKRIPFPGNANGVADNLVAALTATAEQTTGAPITLPFAINNDAIGLAANPLKVINTLLGGMTWIPKIPVPDMLKLAQRLLVFFTSCDARRLDQWEHTSFKDFVKMDGKNANYELIISTVTRTLVAAKEDKASARTICNMGEAFLLNIINRGNSGRFPDQVLNGPTSDVWITPWLNYLQGKGVKFQLGAELQSLSVANGQISGAVIKDASGATGTVQADWYVHALAPEQAVKYFNNDILNLDPNLAKVQKIFVDWMTGIQFFLNTDKPIAAGHIGFIQSPWRLTGIEQNQFWKNKVATTYGDGNVKDILSVDISDWDTPGVLVKKTAKKCSPDEIAKEVWHQITMTQGNVPTLGNTIGDKNLVAWYLDPAIRWDASAGVNTNDDPLMINTAGSWDNRPVAKTAIPNFFLAGDYLRNNIDLATMEGANEGGRNAANAILDASGSDATKATLWPHQTIKEFDGARALDAVRYKAGMRNILDV
ncbi:FAD-dependent oxidoreductase [Nocardia sp. NPDC056000]